MAQTKQKYDKRKFLTVFAVLIVILAGISHLCGFGIQPDKPMPEPPTALPQQASIDEEDDELAFEETDTIVDDAEYAKADSLASQIVNTFTSAKVWSYHDCFPDSNHVQIQAARRNGVTPMHRRDEVLECVAQYRLSDIASSPYYVIDDLTHSMPLLVPRAQTLLNTIGINFVDSLNSKGLPLHLPVVTSVLRTDEDIYRLQHANSNSVTNSCHCYGTTIDITYNRFMPLDSRRETRYDENLKKVLAEVLYDLRADGRCYVKYERRQACFHLTVI